MQAEAASISLTLGRISAPKNALANFLAEAATVVADSQANHGLVTNHRIVGLQRNPAIGSVPALDRFVGIQNQVAQNLQQASAMGENAISVQVIVQIDANYRFRFFRNDLRRFAHDFVNDNVFCDWCNIRELFLVDEDRFDLAGL
jgi:hypothetical protein